MKIIDDNGRLLPTVDIEVTLEDVRLLADTFARIAKFHVLAPGFRITLAGHPVEGDRASGSE
jgi:hypothetical protein